MSSRVSGWSDSTGPTCKHYKISFHLHMDLKNIVRELATKLGPNYGVIRLTTFTYIAFFQGFVNAVGISREEQLEEARLKKLKLRVKDEIQAILHKA